MTSAAAHYDRSVIRVLCRVLLHLFFSSVKIHHGDRVPVTGPVLLVANHHSGLVDPAVLIATLPRTPRFLAKAVLWNSKYLPLRPFLAAANAIPVHRQKDGGGDNESMFSATHDALQEGSAIALFGEGVSHDMPGLLDLKTGAARIALGVDGEVAVVPVGIIYDDRARYRSHVMVFVGEPIAVAGTRGGDADREAVRALTDEIEESLGDVAPSWDNWRQHDDARVAARLIVSARADVSYADALAALNIAVDESTPEALEMCAAVERFEAEVDRVGIDLDVVVNEPQSRLDEIDRRSMLGSLLWWPIVTLGRLVNVLPYLTVRQLAQGRDLNFRATFKILVGLVVYPVWWIVLGVLIGSLSQPLIGVVVGLLAPPLGYLSARINGRLRHVTNRLTVEAIHDIDTTATNALMARRTQVIAATEAILRAA